MGYVSHTVTYDPESPKPWNIICLANKMSVDSYFEEVTARRVCAIQNVRSLPTGAAVYHTGYKKVGRLVSVDSSHAIVQCADRQERWTLGLIQLVAE